MTRAVDPPERGRCIYVVEDDLEIGRLVCAALGEHGFRVEHFRTGADLLRRTRSAAPALCVVDLGLPDMDGLEVIRKLLARRGCAILILSGRQHLADRILGLELGADDYVVKPFEPRELVARINSILRRIEKARGRNAGAANVARFAGWSFDLDSNRLAGPDGRAVELSAAEARLLAALVERPNRILSHVLLLGDREREPFDRSVDVCVSRLRRKLADDSDAPRLIKTVYGAGYMFACPVTWD